MDKKQRRGRKEQEQEETPPECEIVMYSRLEECEILTVSVRMCS